ncbi:PucR family transcriptional regulator [Streptomyces sp. A0958]|uniref:PucR family transcriptional regulator n=1 Tax=Streptomyces sp. A0958 TaxID=2563101 RepID=UPI00109E3944|nr:PucR family transcriptional regulator [Streptomyces sp. A0958]THA71034.1 PucR family transcriptional regulator [Streptomyces sp. A0958]
MHVDHLLRLDRLDLSLVWGDETLLGQEIAGVTATDLEDPARFLQPGEVVLSGLVWWNRSGGPARTNRFVSALREAGAVALLAGEETHGEVPRELVDACRRHRVALIAVPPQTSFRAVTEAVYLRQWGELSGGPASHHALPENVRQDLDRALENGAAAGELLDRAFAHLGTPDCHLLTGSGRTVARTGGAAPLPARRAVEALRGGRGTTVRVESEGTVFDTWYLHLPEEGQVPPRVLEEISGLLGRHRRRQDRYRAARGPAAGRLVEAAGALRTDTGRLRGALESCGLAGRTAYTVVTAVLEPHGDTGGEGVAALTEALSHLPHVAFAVAQGVGGESTAVVAHEEGTTPDVGERLREVWPLIQDRCPESTWCVGLSTPVATPAELNTALGQARYALAAARGPALSPLPVADLRELDELALLLAGVPADVREVYRETVLGPLLKGGARSGAMLLETLEVFLARDCSWARTAEALHVHVNTVHYRVQRIEILTGRDLSRLDHRVDLRAALLC